jgi:hypothetical protein
VSHVPNTRDKPVVAMQQKVFNEYNLIFSGNYSGEVNFAGCSPTTNTQTNSLLSAFITLLNPLCDAGH